MKKPLLYIIVMLFLISLVSGFTEYRYDGQNVYRSSTSIIQSDGVYLGNRNLVEGFQHPYVADLDNDGTLEIIVADGDNIRLFEDVDLSIVDAYDTNADGNISRMYIYDIDDNGLEDIIFFNCADDTFNFVEYNGTAMTNTKQYIHNDPTLQCQSDNQIVYCDEAIDVCLLTNYNQIGGGNVQFLMFNSSHNGLNLGFSEASPICKPATMGVWFGDVDGDSSFEWITTSFWADQLAGVMQGRIHILGDTDHNLSLFEKNTILLDTSIPVGASNCNTFPFENAITSPIVFNYDGAVSNGYEIVVGMLDNYAGGSDYESKLWIVSSDGATFDTYPLATAEGYPISNPIKTDIYSSSGEFEACVMLFAPNSDELGGTYLNLVCGSYQASITIDGSEYSYPIGDITPQYPTVDIGLMYTIDETFTIINGRDPLEIVTSWGIFTPNQQTCNFLNVCELSRTEDFDFENILPADYTVLPIEYDGTFLADYLILTDDVLYYLDDGHSKRDCSQQDCIQEILFDPDICNATVKLNSTLGILLTVSEIDNDLVTCQAIAYVGEGLDELDMGQENVTGSGTMVFGTTLNKSTIFSELQIFCWDTDDPTEVDIHSEYFSVADEGDSFGDSSCFPFIDDIVIVIEDEDDAIATDEGDTGSPCKENTDCDSEKCQYKMCVLKNGNEGCSVNQQCISGNCIGGVCSMPSTFQLLDTAKDQTLGDDTETNNGLALLIILISIGAILLITMGHVYGIVLAVIVAYVEAFVLTLIGWMSPFVLLGFILSAIIGGIVYIILRGDSN